jgi:hypothetical protein
MNGKDLGGKFITDLRTVLDLDPDPQHWQKDSKVFIGLAPFPSNPSLHLTWDQVILFRRLLPLLSLTAPLLVVLSQLLTIRLNKTKRISSLGHW